MTKVLMLISHNTEALLLFLGIALLGGGMLFGILQLMKPRKIDCGKERKD